MIHKKSGQEVFEDGKSSIHLGIQALDIQYDYKKIRKIVLSKSFLKKTRSCVKYRNLYPISENKKLVSLHEGGTPLYKNEFIEKQLRVKHIYFKHEGFNPTGAFKDRGSVVEINKAKQYRAKAIVVASTGNMAASVSAYAALAMIPCFVFVPETTPPAKLAQILLYGATVIKIKGNYDQAVNLTRQAAYEFNLYLAGDYAYRAEGQKSQAFEIIEQLNFQVPDYVLVPVGNGTNIFAIWKGFYEYFIMGLIKKIPQMVAVQIDSYQAIHRAFQKKELTIDYAKIENNHISTVASAVAVKNPSDSSKVLKLLYETKGKSIVVTDEEALKAQIYLASQASLLVEPSSATVFAALKKMRDREEIKSNSSVVCVLTGHGLKDAQSASIYLTKTYVVDPDFSVIKKILNKKI